MLNRITFIFILLFALQLSAQDSGYPFPVLGGQTIQTPATQDTLWILKNSQYKMKIKLAKKNELTGKEISTLKKKIELKQMLMSEQDSLKNIYKEGYDHYRKLWKETDFNLEQARIDASKRWLFMQYGFYGGVIITAVVSALLFGGK